MRARMKNPDRKAALAAALFYAALLLAAAVGCGAGAGGGEEASDLSIGELWARAQEADSGIASLHMEIASYYENTQYGSGPIQSIIIDVSGEDIHERDLLLGQVYFEYKRVGGKQYVKDMQSGTWSEVPGSHGTADRSEYASQFLELPSLAASQEHVGTETIDEGKAEHYRFTLSPESAKEMFSAQPSFDFSENAGADVDVWIDSDQFHLVRYELVIRNVIISEKIGHGDVRFVVNIRDINEAIEITPPI